MRQLVASLLLALCLLAQSVATQEEDDALVTFCSHPKNWIYCEQMLRELAQPLPESAEPQAQMVEKRKPSFVRFGKRASPSESEMNTMEKRKPSFVRFGRK